MSEQEAPEIPEAVVDVNEKDLSSAETDVMMEELADFRTRVDEVEILHSPFADFYSSYSSPICNCVVRGRAPVVVESCFGM